MQLLQRAHLICSRPLYIARYRILLHCQGKPFYRLFLISHGPGGITHRQKEEGTKPIYRGGTECQWYYYRLSRCGPHAEDFVKSGPRAEVGVLLTAQHRAQPWS